VSTLDDAQASAKTWMLARIARETGPTPSDGDAQIRRHSLRRFASVAASDLPRNCRIPDVAVG